MNSIMYTQSSNHVVTHYIFPSRIRSVMPQLHGCIEILCLNSFDNPHDFGSYFRPADHDSHDQICKAIDTEYSTLMKIINGALGEFSLDILFMV